LDATRSIQTAALVLHLVVLVEELDAEATVPVLALPLTHRSFARAAALAGR
jgi:hypothetical protein